MRASDAVRPLPEPPEVRLERPDPSRVRWQTGLVVGGVAVYAALGLAVGDRQLVGVSGWLAVTAWLLLLSGTAVSGAVAVRSPRPAVPGRYPQGLAADGPELRRVRRALRHGAPLDPTDRDRALWRARLRVTGGGARAWWALLAQAFLMTAVIASEIETPPRLDVPTALAGAGLALMWTTAALSSRRRPARRRSRALVERLQQHPVTDGAGRR